MKKGFTLAEALITLSIIGIIVAITLPAVNRLRPDENKVKYLQSYDALSEATRDMVSNSKEYPMCGEVKCRNNNVNFNFSQAPLMNYYGSVNGSISSQNGFNNDNYDQVGNFYYRKFCTLLAWQFGINDFNCESSGLAAPDNPPTFLLKAFTTNNGVEWAIDSTWVTKYSSNCMNNEGGIDIIIDVNGRNKAPNCMRRPNNQEACPKPDRFWFLVTAQGRVIAGDIVGKAFIRSRKSLTYKSYDTAGLSEESWYDNDNKKFTLTLCE